MSERPLADHHAIALYLASRPGTTYKDVAVQLRQHPATILSWLNAGLRGQQRTAGPQAPDQSRPMPSH